MPWSRKFILVRARELSPLDTITKTAWARAFAEGRVDFFKDHSSGALPKYLSVGNYRLRVHYDARGNFIGPGKVNSNPVRVLNLSTGERRAIEREVSLATAGRGRDIRRAAKLYSDFTGDKEISVSKISVPEMPSTVALVGKIDGVLYTTVLRGRGGRLKTERYIHEFKSKARPLFAVSPDGTQLLMLGGAYNFTERGIVDKR